ncbi:hypothetical protein [Desulfogranum japonicum]|uniref:hypothetical protein n=1 Tax=Desulfogranum japonicum TaxID=231447 RepID=UPI00048D4920|nr:hypothetical protein [Desulfogranum japonicum]
MATNVWRQFKRLIDGEPMIIVTVTAHNSDGTSTVETYGGGSARLPGQAVAVNSKAFAQGGEIKGEAPSLTYSEQEV